ncbi:Hypothetical_protein [Hexamita inflata]|uniref:Hypothetical_protein n=1 Tax=Hexamita inflata TaxID=28002 RepID=A0AA86QZB3_9EUKA|nr:Hypothetical protein HINF_LOCUS50109 [Hexamita inflata]
MICSQPINFNIGQNKQQQFLFAPVITSQALTKPILQNDEIQIKIKQSVINGELEIIGKKLKDLSFIDTLNVHKLELKGSDSVVPEFTSKTVKELIIRDLRMENFKNIKLENLETLKISIYNSIECQYLAQVRTLEIFDVKNVEQLFSRQNAQISKNSRFQTPKQQAQTLYRLKTFKYCGCQIVNRITLNQTQIILRRTNTLKNCTSNGLMKQTQLHCNSLLSQMWLNQMNAKI